MIRHITYATKEYETSAMLAYESSLKYGCDQSAIFNPDLIDSTFWGFNMDIFEHERGAGYWLWKPYFILINLLQMEEGNYLVYTDAGVQVVDDVNHIISKMKVDVFLFANQYNHEHWCKGNVTDHICGFRKEWNQVQASAMVFRVSGYSRRFVREWLAYCQVPGFIDDSEGYNNHPEFREHRHDQAVLTCVAFRNGIPLHWWPATYNDGMFNYPKQNFNDEYPVIFHHHRKRNDEWV